MADGMPENPEQPTLFEEPITVHCFLCRFIIQDYDPDRAHERMEEHYQEFLHALEIRRITGDR